MLDSDDDDLREYCQLCDDFHNPLEHCDDSFWRTQKRIEQLLSRNNIRRTSKKLLDQLFEELKKGRIK
jgi:hypothetical protein